MRFGTPTIPSALAFRQEAYGWNQAGIKANRAHFHDIRAKSISDNASLDNAYLLAGHIDIKMTRRTYDRNRRRVEPLR